MASLWASAVALGLGAAFGIAQEKAAVVVPNIIVGQFTWKEFNMMKFFLSAASTSFAANTILYLASSWTRKRLTAAREANTITNRTPTGVVIGATLLGCGMALAGTCPGTVFPQIGSLGSIGLTVAAGGLVGVGVFALLEHHLSPSLKALLFRSNPVDTSLEKPLRTSFPLLAVPLALILFGGALLFEYLYPDPNVPLFSTSISALIPSFSARSWSPVVCGIITGLLQIPLTLFFNQSLGASSAYVSTVSSIVGLVSPSAVGSSRVLSEKSGSKVNTWWQIPFILGSILGAYSTSNYPPIPSNGPWLGFLGGVLMLIGSRMGDGCTSGHGVSGMSQLSKYSIAAVPAMFGSAIATALSLKFAGVY